MKHARLRSQRWTNRLEAMTTKQTILSPLTGVKHATLRDKGAGDILTLEIDSSLFARSQGQSSRRFAKLAARTSNSHLSQTIHIAGRTLAVAVLPVDSCGPREMSRKAKQSA